MDISAAVVPTPVASKNSGKIQRDKLNPLFDTYKLASTPLFRLQHHVDLKAPARMTSTINSKDRDFASTYFRVNFNDLQPDRSSPQSIFYFLAADASNSNTLHIQRIKLRDREIGDCKQGNNANQEEHAKSMNQSEDDTTTIDVEHIWTLRNEEDGAMAYGQPVTLCGHGSFLLVCQHTGRLDILVEEASRDVWSVAHTMNLQADAQGPLRFRALDFMPDDDGLGLTCLVGVVCLQKQTRSELSANSGLNGQDAKVRPSSIVRMIRLRRGVSGGDSQGSAATPWRVEIDEEIKLSSEDPAFLARLSSPRIGAEGMTVDRVHVDSVGVGGSQFEGGPHCDLPSIVIVSCAAIVLPNVAKSMDVAGAAVVESRKVDVSGPDDHQSVDSPGVVAGKKRHADDIYEDIESSSGAIDLEMEASSQELPLFAHVCCWRSTASAWTCSSCKILGEDSGCSWIGQGGPEHIAGHLPLIGVKCKSGVGMYDLHAVRLEVENDDNCGEAIVSAYHLSSFFGLGYIQEAKENKKFVTFCAPCEKQEPGEASMGSSEASFGFAFVVDTTESVYVYKGCSTSARTSKQEVLEGCEVDEVIGGFQALRHQGLHRLLVLSSKSIRLFTQVRQQAEEPEEEQLPARSSSQVQALFPAGIPEHLLDDW